MNEDGEGDRDRDGNGESVSCMSGDEGILLCARLLVRRGVGTDGIWRGRLAVGGSNREEIM
jgi:hypothetical protein